MTNTFEERVNPTYCNILAKITLEQFKKFYSSAEIDENGDNMEITTQFNLLRNYCADMIKCNYSRISTYKHSGNKTEGRLFLKEKMGLQRIWNKFRGVLSDGITRDLDMISCHPNLLVYLCKQYDITTNRLNIYVNSRKEILDNLLKDDKIKKDEAKILFLKSINDNEIIDRLGKKKIKNGFFIEFDKEMKEIQNKLSAKFPELLKECKKTKPNNPEGSLVNNLLCKLENEILQKAIKSIQVIFKVSVLMFDGLMHFTRNDITITDREVIDRLNAVSQEYGIKWDYKEHNTEIKDILDDLEIIDNINFFIGDTEQDVANYCVNNLFKNKLIKCQGEVYIYDNKIWTKHDTINIIAKELGKHDLYITTSKGDRLISKDTKGQDSLSKMIMRNVKVDDDFAESMYLSTLNKICFQNGFYDFTTGLFHVYTDNNIPLTPFIIPRDYTTNKDGYDDLYKKVFYPTFNIKFDDNGVLQDDDNLQRLEHLRFILHKFSKMIAGQNKTKEWMMFLGDRNSGKGIFQELFLNSFCKYITETNSGNFIEKSASGGTDLDKLYAFMAKFEFARLVFMNEVKKALDSKGKNIYKFDSEIIKKLTSGGDLISCRVNNKDARQFHIQSSFIMNCNDEPSYTSQDAKDFLIKFNMPCRFLTDESYNKYSDELKKQFVRQVADETIKTDFCKRTDIIESFTNLIFDAYKWEVKCPDYIKAEMEEEKEETDYSSVLNLFIKVDDASSTLSNKKIMEIIEANKIPFSLDKVSKILVKAGYNRIKLDRFTRGYCNIMHVIQE